ncbi:MAG: class I SAM-dependent methyltransferase [Gemmatimonadales bacterium]|nr:class I SAM-dependent methyltransferase [Gemmatimonadales bacterium]
MGAMNPISSCGAPTRRALLALALVTFPATLAAQEASAPARTPDVHFVPTAVEVVRAMLGAAKVNKQDVVYDLGCGDGRLVITAVKRYGARRGVCVDIDPVRIKESRQNADTAGVAKQIEFMNADLFETDLSEATVVTLYLLPMLNVRLRPKLFRELEPGTRVVSNSFDMGEWKADSTINVKNDGGFSSFAYYWRVPADVAGTWKVAAPGVPGGSYSMKLEQRFQEVTGTAEVDGQAVALVDEKLKGDSLSFTLRDGSRATRLTGTVDGAKMSGTMSGGQAKGKAWTATRTLKGKRQELVDSTGLGQ